MNLSAFLYTLASVPMFASRPFLAAFVTATLARFGTDLPWIGDNKVIVALSQTPEWFRSWPLLVALAALAVTEAMAVKHAEVREFMTELDGYLKSAVSLLVAFAILDAETVNTIEAIHRAGVGFESTFALVVAALVYGMAGLRRQVMDVLAEVDDDDDIGLQSVLNWVENSWTVLGLLFLVVFPVAALVLSALTALGLWLVRRYAEHRELRSMVSCAQCAAAIFPHATRCHVCSSSVAEPRAVGVLGTPKSAPAADLGQHRFELIARKRCPSCANRLKKRSVRQACATCRTVTFASEAEFESYLGALEGRLPKTLLVCLALSAIPLIGVIPGVLYYRLTLVSGLRGYVPPLRGIFSRVLVRLIHWGLIVLQPIPVVGATIVPLMCWSTYAIYRRALNGRAAKDLAAAHARPAA